MKTSSTLKLIQNETPVPEKLGSYYIKPHKSGWSLYHQAYDGNNKRTQKTVPRLSYKDLGFRDDMSLEEARARCKRLNKQNDTTKQTIRKAAVQLEKIESENDLYFPVDYIQGFNKLLTDENQGSDQHLRKLISHFKFVQKMCIKLKLFPQDYKEANKKIYNYFVSERISVNYSQRLIKLMNRYGKFVCKLEGRYFEEIQQARGISKENLNEAHEDKEGVRTESKPLDVDLLNRKKEKLSEENFNWLFISLWFGLRPSDFSGIKDCRIEKNKDGAEFLAVYQSKLKSLPKPKRYKYIPILFSEQKLAVKIIESGLYKAPIYKIMRAVFGEGFGLYAGRKGFTDLMLTQGYSIEDISLWLGHTSIETTWKHYKERNVLNLSIPKIKRSQI